MLRRSKRANRSSWKDKDKSIKTITEDTKGVQNKQKRRDNVYQEEKLDFDEKQYMLYQKFDKKKGKLSNTEFIKTLMRPPKKKGYLEPMIAPTNKNNYKHMADLIYLSYDEERDKRENKKTYKYALVIVDVGSRIVDARPLKTKKSNEVVKAFKSIYNGKYLKQPVSEIRTDQGSEFKGKFKEYVQRIDVKHSVSMVGHHAQNTLAERYNQLIANALYHKQNVNEYETGEPNVDWIDDLKNVIALINKYVQKDIHKKMNKKIEEYMPEGNIRESGAEYNYDIKDDKIINMKKSNKHESKPSIKCDKLDCHILKEGTKVRPALLRPHNVFNNKPMKTTSERFRSTDIRFDPREYKIIQVLLNPFQPPMYRIQRIQDSFVPKRAYARNKLMLI